MNGIPTAKTTPQNIPEAYEDLTPQAFAAWIRLATAAPEQLKNRDMVAALLNYSISQVTIIARELTALKYVLKYRTNPANRETGWLVIKKPTLSSGAGFVVLNMLAAGLDPNSATHELGRRKRQTQKEYKRRLYSTSISGSNYADERVLERYKAKKRPMAKALLPESGKPLRVLDAPALGAQENPTKCEKHKTKKRPMASAKTPGNQNAFCGQPAGGGGYSRLDAGTRERRESGLCGENLDHGILLNTLNIELFRKKIKAKKIRDKKTKLKRVSRRDTSPGKGKKTVKTQPDWSKLEQDLRNNPRITFSPSAKHRLQYVEIFNRSNRSIERQELLKKFGSEFGRIYSRYRRLLQKEKGGQPTYCIAPRDMRYSAPIAELCIRKEVTPRQLLAYWHNHIGDFSDAKLIIPPLAFLSSPANVDTVACSDLKALDKKEQDKRMSPGANSFSDLKLYDGRVRQVLQKAGFDLRQYSDRELMSIQFSARSLAQGIDMFVDKETLPMAKHLAKTLYKGLKLEF